MPRWEQDFHGKSKIGKLVCAIGSDNWCEQELEILQQQYNSHEDKVSLQKNNS